MADSTFYGPFTPTVGQPFEIALPPDIDRIDVQNDGPYDIWLYFGNVKPTDLANTNNTWHRAVRRGHNQTMSIYGPRGASSRERSPNAFGAFQGKIWVMAVNPGGLALTGTQSGRNQIYITPLFPGDPSPVHSALATQVDVSSQARQIAIPVTPTYLYTGPHDFTAVGQTFAPFPSPFAVAPAPGTWNGTQFVQVYLYFVNISLRSVASGGLWIQLAIQVDELDSSFSVVTSHVMHWCEVRSNPTNGTGYEHGFYPAFPQSLQFQPGNTTAYLRLSLVNNNAGAADTSIYYNIGIDADIHNQQVVPSIGGGLTGLVGPTGSAPLF